jgi:ABC-type phosphate/phosphonate transport system substrate-binding protein
VGNHGRHEALLLDVRRGQAELTAIPASMTASAGDRITFNVGPDAVKRLERE